MQPPRVATPVAPHRPRIRLPPAQWQRFQPEVPLTLNAFLATDIPADDERILQAAEWVLDREVTKPGDWQFKGQGVGPGGWYFEYANESYPDCDDTAEALIALSHIRFPDEARDFRRRDALRRALRWEISMQNRDGGWAAFDKDCDMALLTHVPFADHNAMIDPSNEDITARILETFACLGYGVNYPAAARALRFLLPRQEADGSWYGRWGDDSPKRFSVSADRPAAASSAVPWSPALTRCPRVLTGVHWISVNKIAGQRTPDAKPDVQAATPAIRLDRTESGQAE